MAFGLENPPLLKLKPYFEVERPPCPFYGFERRMSPEIMKDQEGNQCGLITEYSIPCQMEVEEQEPNWRECPLNTEKIARSLEESAGGIKVFPREFRPQTAKGEDWFGVSLKDWADHTLKPK